MTAAQPYIAVSRRALDLEDYFSIARRHYGWIAGPAFAGLVISTVVAFCLPNVYVARAVMQIAPSQISENLVQSVVNQQLTERIQQMESNITSRQSLATLINDPRLNLYKDLKNKEPLEDIEDEMRQAVHIVINPEISSRKGASIFTISFEYGSRKGAQDTVNALITRFIAESTNSQRDQQATLTEFFGDEVAQAKANLEKQTEALNRFRKDNEGRLPEQESMNIAALTSLQTEVNGIDQDLSRLSNEKLTLQTQITYLENELKLNSSFAQEIADSPLPTSAVARQNDDLNGINKSIEQLELDIQRLKQIYRPNYPDVKNAETNLKILQKKRDDLVAAQAKDQADEAAKPKPVQKKATNFNALASQTKIEGDIAHARALLQNNENDRDARLKKRESLNKEIGDYRARLAATSALEANYADLKRDYATAAEKYEKYQKQKDLTTQSGDLISRRATEYLDVLDPPTTPQKPTRPNRYLIVGAGFGLSLMLGFALAGLQEARDSSLKNLKDVRAYTNLPVLCSIPLLENTLLVKRKRRITALAWSAAVIVGILAVCGALVYYSSVISNT
jgi:polysaccharide chain length determinant protein (PEP-CTERM system associated)